MTFAEATQELGKSPSYLNNLVATGKLVEGLHFRGAGRVKLVTSKTVEQIKAGTFTGGLAGAKWGDLTRVLQINLLLHASCIDGVTGDTAFKGECIVDLTEKYAVSGEIIEYDVVIQDEAEIYCSAGLDDDE